MLFTMLQLVPIAAMNLCSPVAPIPATSTMDAAPVRALSPLPCLEAFSKDYCDGFMYPGNESTVGCPFGTQDCKALDVQGATLYLPMRANQELCSSDGRCNEVKDGYLKVDTTYAIRLNKPCPYRGCISGRGEWRSDTGDVFEGELMGTIGVGTHRRFECLEARNCYCEKCLDVEFSVPHNAWRIGFEAAFHGKNNNGNGETVCISLSGDFYVEGTAHGPFDLNGNFKVKGTADGILRTFCH